MASFELQTPLCVGGGADLGTTECLEVALAHAHFMLATHTLSPPHTYIHTPPPVCDNKNISTHCQMSLGSKQPPYWELLFLKKKKRFLVITKNFFFFNPLSICQHDSLLPAHPMGHKWPICVNLWHLVTNVLSSNPKLPQTTHKCPEYCASCFLFLAVTDGPTPSLCLSPEHGAMAPSALMK